MIKRDYQLEELNARWPVLPWWLKLKIVIMITWYSWDKQLAEWWLRI